MQTILALASNAAGVFFPNAFGALASLGMGFITDLFLRQLPEPTAAFLGLSGSGVPLEHSEHYQLAVQQGAQQALQQGARMFLVYILPAPANGADANAPPGDVPPAPPGDVPPAPQGAVPLDPAAGVILPARRASAPRLPPPPPPPPRYIRWIYNLFTLWGRTIGSLHGGYHGSLLIAARNATRAAAAESAAAESAAAESAAAAAVRPPDAHIIQIEDLGNAQEGNAQNAQEDPQNAQNAQEDPQNAQNDPQNAQNDPQNAQEEEEDAQEDPQNAQNAQDDPQNAQEEEEEEEEEVPNE